MKTIFHHLSLALLLFACNSQISGELSDHEQERATAFMSGMMKKDGAWVTPAQNFDVKDFAFDMTTSDFPYHLQGATSGTNYIQQIQRADRSKPEFTWKEKYQEALEAFNSIENDGKGGMVNLINYELVTFPFLRHYLGQVNATHETAEALVKLIPLLVQKGTHGELDLLAENLKKHAPPMPAAQKEALVKLIQTRCEETLSLSGLEAHRKDKTLAALEILENM